MSTYAAVVIAHSIAFGVQLITLELTFPRFILAEFNTHRMFSRNSASSRAIPVERRIEQILRNPFVPIAFGANRPGMMSESMLETKAAQLAELAWLGAMHACIAFVRILVALEVHKQWANRIIEVWSWHTVVVTSTEWENFFALRTHKAAQPEMQEIARMAQHAVAASTPRELKPGQWHLPYIDHEYPADAIGWLRDQGIKVSVARCAAVSFERQYAEKTAEQYAARHDDLLKSAHMSPFEHQAQVVEPLPPDIGEDGEEPEYGKPFTACWRNDGARWPNGEIVWEFGGYFCGNLRAPWLQYRKTLPGEAIFQERNAA